MQQQILICTDSHTHTHSHTRTCTYIYQNKKKSLDLLYKSVTSVIEVKTFNAFLWKKIIIKEEF